MPKPPKSKPSRIYKYRAFNTLALEMLVEDKLFFADPSTFNDPLDAKPSFDADLPAADLENVLRTLVERRVTDEMQAAARKIHYRGPRTIEHIDRHARLAAENMLAGIRYNATNYEIADPLQYLLGESVHDEVIRRYDRGIVSFAKRANCPLMWSHYGDQHEGICIGYSAPADVKLEPMAYGGERSLKASVVKAMVEGDAEAARRVDGVVLLKKAYDWRYEHEWRLIGDRGLHDSPLELEEVVFGMRCPLAVQFAVAKALAERKRGVKLYKIYQKRGTFLLKKGSADLDEIMATWPRRARSILEAFADVVLESGTPLEGLR